MGRFDVASKNWDKNERRNKMNKHILNYIREKIDFKNKILADFGCGTGNIGISLINETLKTIFIDKSQGMLDIVADKLKNVNENRYEIIHVDNDNQLRTVEKFDILISTLVFHHIENIELVIENIYSRLNNGGKIIIIDLTIEDGSFHRGNFDGHKGFDKKNIEKILTIKNFKNVKVEEFYVMDKLIENEIKKFPMFIAIGEKHE